MGNLKITQRSAEALAATGKEETWWDTELRGFGLKVTAAGSKVFLIQYRMGGRGAPTRRVTVGKLGSPWTVPTARSEAERLLRLVATGVDPFATEKARRQADIELEFGKYAERFLEEYGKRQWRPRTFQSRATDLRRWVIPVLKNRGLPSITRRDITDVFDRLPAAHPALPRNVFAVTRKLFVWAQQRGDIDRSPCEGVKSPAAVPARDRVLDDEELMLVAGMAGELDAPFGPFVFMLLITGQRRDEVAAMTWDELDRDKREWVIPAARSKNHRAHLMPLSATAVRELDRMAGRERWPQKGLVFTTTGATPVSGFSRMKRRLDSLIEEAAQHRIIKPWRIHDLRRTMATNLQRLGVRFEVTEALLNHVSGARSGIAGVYQRHDWHDEKRQAIDLWDAKLGDMAVAFAERVADANARTDDEPRLGHQIIDGRAVRVLLPRRPSANS